MKIYPHAEKQLATMPPEQLKAMLLWYLSDENARFDATTETINAVMDDLEAMDAKACYEAMSALGTEAMTDEMVRFSLLNEFGEWITTKSWFNWLTEAVKKQLAMDNIDKLDQAES